MRFDLSQGFPLVTTKRVHIKTIAYELLWFLRGESNVAGCRSKAFRSGTNGPTMRVSWGRSTACSGALADGVRRTSIRSPARSASSARSRLAPDHRDRVECRGHPRMALAPCHAFFQFHVAGERLSLPDLPALRRRFPRRAVQHRELCAADAHARAADRLEPGDLVWTGGDCHIYDNHREQVETLLARDPFAYPTLRFAPGRRRSWTTGTRTSRWSATSTIRRSARRSQCDRPLVAAVPAAADRSRRRNPVAPPGRHAHSAR